MNDYVLAHHGVKGMHWGIRRYRNKDGSLTEEGKAHARQQAERDADNAKRQEYAHAAKNVRTLSDEELIARIGRLEREKRLVELTADNLYNNHMMSSGQKATRDVLTTSGKVVAKAAFAGGSALLGRAIVSGAFSPYGGVFDLDSVVRPAQVAAYMFPNPNKKK